MVLKRNYPAVSGSQFEVYELFGDAGDFIKMKQHPGLTIDDEISVCLRFKKYNIVHKKTQQIWNPF